MHELSEDSLMVDLGMRDSQYMRALNFFFSSRRRHTSLVRDWSSDVCSSDLILKDEQVLKMPDYLLSRVFVAFTDR